MSHSLSKKFTFGSLLLFALPTTVMMVVMSLYTIVDGVFVSRFVSTNALSSVNIVYPVINIVLGISVMLSMGSNAIVAKKMGEVRPDSARETFTAIILLNIIIGLAFAIIGNLTAVPLSRMLGGQRPAPRGLRHLPALAAGFCSLPHASDPISDVFCHGGEARHRTVPHPSGRHCQRSAGLCADCT